MLIDKKVTVEQDEIYDIIIGEIELRVDEYGTSIQVDVSEQSLVDAAQAVMYEIEDKWPNSGDDEVVAKLRHRQHELAHVAQVKIQSQFVGDWMQAVVDQRTADTLKNILAEVGV